MSEDAPTAVFPQVGCQVTDEVVQGSIPTRPQLVAQGCLVLIETVAHRHAHFQSGSFTLSRDAGGRRQRIRDRLFGKNM